MARFLLPLLAAVLAVSPVAAAPPPNVVLFLADDLGFSDLGCYGGEIKTPNLDKLAADGLKFTQFYNTCRCWPSRAATMTGYYAQQVRRDKVPGVASGAGGVRPAWAPLLPVFLSEAGYRTYHSGKWHIDSTPLKSGFHKSYGLNDHNRHFAPKQHTLDDKPLPPVDPKSGYYSTTHIAGHAVECLKEHAEKYGQQPFFSFVAFTAPHFPVQASPGDIEPYSKTYLAGWDKLREARWARQKFLKDAGASLSPIERDLGPPYDFPKAIKALGPNEVKQELYRDFALAANLTGVFRISGNELWLQAVEGREVPPESRSRLAAALHKLSPAREVRLRWLSYDEYPYHKTLNFELKVKYVGEPGAA